MSAASTRISAGSSFLQLLKNKTIFGAETFPNTPHKTRKDPKGDDTFNLSGAAKSIQRGKNSRGRELSGAGVLTTSVVNNL